jgi:hypothetical protein
VEEKSGMNVRGKREAEEVELLTFCCLYNIKKERKKKFEGAREREVLTGRER